MPAERDTDTDAHHLLRQRHIDNSESRNPRGDGQDDSEEADTQSTAAEVESTGQNAASTSSSAAVGGQGTALSEEAKIGDDTKQVRCIVSFMSRAVPLTPGHWNGFSITAKATDTMQDLNDVLEDKLLTRLENDQTLNELLYDQEKLLVYQVEIHQSICVEQIIRLWKSEHPTHSLRDLFTGPQDDWSLETTVHLTMNKRVKSHPNQPTHDYLTKDEEDLPLNSIVYERQWLEQATDRRRYVWVRLGLISQRDDTSSPKEPSETTSEHTMTAPAEVEQSSEGQDIEQREVLVGWYFESDQDDLHLMSVPAWDFGEHWIGDCFNVWEYHDFDPNDEYLPHFAGAIDLAQLHTKVKAYLAGRKSAGEPGLPFMPKFTLEVFDPMCNRCGAPGEAAQVVFHFVTHVDLRYQGDDPAQLLPYGVQYRVDADDGAEEIKAILVDELRRHSKDTELAGPLERTALSRLFAKPLAGRWNLVLWVLPRNGGTSMFRFPTGRDGVGAKKGLDQFLDPASVRSNVPHARALFIEAHIVKIGDEEEHVVFKEVEEEDWNDDDAANASDGQEDDVEEERFAADDEQGVGPEHDYEGSAAGHEQRQQQGIRRSHSESTRLASVME